MPSSAVPLFAATTCALRASDQCVRALLLIFWLFTSYLPLRGAEPSITVASLNLAMKTDVSAIATQIRALPDVHHADVLLFQEVMFQNGRSVAEPVAKQLGLHLVTAAPDGRNSRSGLAVLSRFPLVDQRIHRLKPQNLVFRSRSRISLAVTVLAPFGPVRIIDTHLDTRINPAERLAQLAPALDDASCFHGPSIIGGDFNTNDMQWVSNVVPVPFPGWQGERVRALMASRGFQTPFTTRQATFDHLGMQLDWIYAAGLRAQASGVVPCELSDHHAVWARLSPASGSAPRTEHSQAARRSGA